MLLDDGDVDAAVEATVTACFLCAGQSCTAGERILVHRAVYDEYVAKLARAVTEQIVLGDPFDDATTMGPLNNEGVAAKMDEHVSDALQRGAEALTGGERAAAFPTDLYWEPTVLAGVPADARVSQEETFGPVAPVVEIGSLDQAIELANASPYGLLSAIFTADLNKGLRYADEVHTGWVNINESSNYWEAHLPFGGRAGHRLRHRQGRRRPRDALVHRAADGRDHARRAPLVSASGGRTPATAPAPETWGDERAAQLLAAVLTRSPRPIAELGEELSLAADELQRVAGGARRARADRRRRTRRRPSHPDGPRCASPVRARAATTCWSWPRPGCGGSRARPARRPT